MNSSSRLPDRICGILGRTQSLVRFSIHRSVTSAHWKRSWCCLRLTELLQDGAVLGLSTLPLALHPKVLGLNMTIQYILSTFINTLEKKQCWGVLQFYAMCFSEISIWEQQPHSPLCELEIQLSPNIGSWNGQGFICVLRNEVISPWNMLKLWSACTCDTKNWQVKCWTADVQANPPCLVVLFFK